MKNVVTLLKSNLSSFSMKKLLNSIPFREFKSKNFERELSRDKEFLLIFFFEFIE